MVRSLLIAGAALVALAGPTLAQSPREQRPVRRRLFPDRIEMMGEDVGVPPMTGVSTSRLCPPRSPPATSMRLRPAI